MKNVLEWLEDSASRHGLKIAYRDSREETTFAEVENRAKRIGSYLASRIRRNQPVAVFSSRSCQTPSVFLGIVYAGGVYAPLDGNQPEERLKKILAKMEPEAIVVDQAMKAAVNAVLEESGIPMYVVEEILHTEIDETLLQIIRREMISTDPLYIIYTSGSTGLPKGVLTSHDSLIRYIDAYCSVMDITGEDILGNQSPLDYIAAIRDIYLPLKTGCSMAIIPKEYFMQPVRLFEYMNKMKITSVGWSVSAFTIPVALGAFDEAGLTTLRKICFSGSVMPGKCIRKWQQNLPDARFVNQYGPTEATASCTYYEVDHLVEEGEVLPIGRAYENYRVFILKEDGRLAKPGEKGEICITGPCLALGYYKDPERTAKAFVTSPLEEGYEVRMYKTGDIGMEREDHLLEFCGRKDRQIKHMGHRVELDEIEVAANQIPGMKECCCSYEHEKEKIYLFYAGEVEKKLLFAELKKKLPGFMIPRSVQCMDELPKLSNGKIDMKKLKESTK